MKFTISNEVAGLMMSAGSRSSSDYSFYLNGDLCQMGAQKSFLIDRGFDVQQSDVYPVLKQEDKTRALKAIWESRCDGWWHYREDYIKLDICSGEEWGKALDDQCAKKGL